MFYMHKDTTPNISLVHKEMRFFCEMQYPHEGLKVVTMQLNVLYRRNRFDSLGAAIFAHKILLERNPCCNEVLYWNDTKRSLRLH